MRLCPCGRPAYKHNAVCEKCKAAKYNPGVPQQERKVTPETVAAIRRAALRRSENLTYEDVNKLLENMATWS